ncbi:calcium/proton exchanger [Tanacetum coccineum]
MRIRKASYVQFGQGKKDKNRVFIVNLKHDGIFSPYPFSYIHGDHKQLTDFDFEGMSYDNLRELVRKLVHSTIGYQSKWVVDLYVEHHGYDPMDYKNSNARDYESLDSSDAYCSSDEEHVIDYVDFYHEGEQDVVVKNITTNDPFLTKLCSNNGNFRGFINEPIPVNEDLHIEDHDSSGMRFDHPEQLKLALANYGVAGGYQLWFKKNYWRELLVYYGRDVSTRRCAGYFSKKVKAKKQLFKESYDDANKGTSKDGEGSSIVDDEETEYGNTYFKRFYICFKGVKDGWKVGCRRVTRLDGCFLKHTCRGELLTAIGRDVNNQMYPIAWAVVQVENAENWCWFISLLAEDLELGHGTGITVISDSHKGLLDAVSEWLPNAEHRKCTRHVFANFKKKFSGVQLQRLFWVAAGTTVESIFYNNMDQIKAIIPEAYTYLVERNPDSWSRAFFDLNSKCASFENGIA